MPYYVVARVSASSRGASPGPDITTSRVLGDFGFQAENKKPWGRMNHDGAVPKLDNIVIRFECEQAKLFKLMRVEKDGKKARIFQIDSGRVDIVRDGDEVTTISGPGRLQWDITFGNRPILESSLLIRGEIVYDTGGKTKQIEREAVCPIALIPKSPPVPATMVPPKDRAEIKPAAVVEIVRSQSTALPGNGPLLKETPAVAPKGDDIVSRATTPPMEAKVGEYVTKLKVSELVPDPRQPREYFCEADLHAMAESMREEAQVVSIIVRSVPTDSSGRKFMIIDGERR